MADTSATAAQMARILAILHFIVGVLLFCFGIADLVVGYFWTGYGCFGIWIGVWMCIAGGLGIPGTRKERSTSRSVFASIFMGFSITSAVFGGIIIICYSLSIAIYRDHYYYYSGRYSKRYYDEEMALTVIILILGIVEFAIGIWVSVCICLTNPCCYNTQQQQQQQQQQQGQVMYTANTGYVVTQGPSGVPMTMPMQAGGGMIAVQATTTGTQGGQPQMVSVPVSGAMGNLHLYAPQAAPHSATSYQSQQVQMPPVHGQGQYVALENELIPVKI